MSERGVAALNDCSRRRCAIRGGVQDGADSGTPPPDGVTPSGDLGDTSAALRSCADAPGAEVKQSIHSDCGQITEGRIAMVDIRMCACLWPLLTGAHNNVN